jgi:hypothetical protein
MYQSNNILTKHQTTDCYNDEYDKYFDNEQLEREHLLNETKNGIVNAKNELISIIDVVSVEQQDSNDSDVIVKFNKKFREFVVLYHVTSTTTNYVHEIINNIWNKNDTVKARSTANSDILTFQNESLRKCIIGMIIRTITDLLKEDFNSFNKDHTYVMNYIMLLIVSSASLDHNFDTKNYLDCIEMNVDDPFYEAYYYLVTCNYLETFHFNNYNLKLILRRIVDAFAITNSVKKNDSSEFASKIDTLLKQIRVKNIDVVFNNDYPKDTTKTANNVFDTLETIDKVTVLGCTDTVFMLLQESGYDDNLLKKLIAIAIRYGNTECYDYLLFENKYTKIKISEEKKKNKKSNDVVIDIHKTKNDKNNKNDKNKDDEDDEDEDEDADFYLNLSLLCGLWNAENLNEEAVSQLCTLL